MCFSLLVAPAIGFSHAVIPHGHTHTSDAALHTIIAHGLEQALTRKDILVPYAFVSVLMAYALRVRMVRGAVGQVDTWLHTSALRRGIFPYRRFD